METRRQDRDILSHQFRGGERQIQLRKREREREMSRKQIIGINILQNIKI